MIGLCVRRVSVRPGRDVLLPALDIELDEGGDAQLVERANEDSGMDECPAPTRPRSSIARALAVVDSIGESDASPVSGCR